MSMKLINQTLLQTIFSNLKKNYFKNTKHGLRNKYLIEKILQHNIIEIDYITRGQNEIILWYKNYETKDRHVISLYLNNKVKEQELITIKTILQFDNIFIISTTAYVFKTDLKSIDLLYTSEEEFIAIKFNQVNLMLLTGQEILTLCPYSGKVITKYKNPLNKIENIFIINNDNCYYLLKIYKPVYSLININNHNDEKVLKLKGFDGDSLKDVLQADENHLFIYKNFIVKYNIKENQFIDLYTTSSKIRGYFINNEALVLYCKQDNNTYLLNLDSFTVEKRLIFPCENYRKKLIYNDYIICEGENNLNVYYKDYRKKKVITKPYLSHWFMPYITFNLSDRIIVFNSSFHNQRIDIYNLSIKKDNIKINILEIGEAAQLRGLYYIKENYIAVSFNNKFVIYDYIAKRVYKVFNNNGKLIYLGKLSTYKLLFFDTHYLVVYDLSKDSKFVLHNIELSDFVALNSKILVIDKHLIYTNGEYLFITPLNRYDPFQLETHSKIKGLYKHCHNDQFIVTYANGFNIFSLKEKRFLRDLVVLDLNEVKIIKAAANSREIVFLNSVGNLITYNFKDGRIEYRELGKAYKYIIKITDTSIMLCFENECHEISLTDFTCLSKFRI
jgi:hypothetical protein